MRRSRRPDHILIVYPKLLTPVLSSNNRKNPLDQLRIVLTKPEMFTFTSHSPQETHRFAQSLGQILEEPICIALDGDLGAGKTTFVQGLAEGLDIRQTPVSPTFSLMIEYMGRLPLLHVDLYRIEDRDLLHLGLEEQLEEWAGISVVEWASRFPEQLPWPRIEIFIRLSSEDRHFQVNTTDAKLQEILGKWSVLWPV